MTMTWDEAVTRLTAPGGDFELIETEVGGSIQKVFARTPGSLRDLFAVARMYGDAEYLVYEDERWGFDRLTRQIDELGDALVNRYGVRPGDRVAIAMRNYPEWITSFAAVTSVGAVAVALNAWWLHEELAYGLEDSGSRLVICDSERFERVRDLIGDSDLDAIVVRHRGDLPPGAAHLEEILEPGARLPEVVVDTDADATILYTSGTTGHPKGAVSTHRAVLTALMGFACRAAVAALVDGAETAPTDETGEALPTTAILCIPLFHVTGLVPVMLGTFVSGSRLVMMYRWDPRRALELIERERITQFVGVPTMSWELLECEDFDRFDTSSLRSVGGGGAPAPPELVQRIEDRFSAGRPGIGYGMTETNALGPQNAGDTYLRRPTSVGRAAPNMDVMVIDGEGRPLGPGERGEICFRGANLIRGYWNRPEATAETIVDGWLRSGDIGYIDEEGFVYVSDRAKDMVLRGGENIYCAEVEAAVYEHPAVYEAAVFALPHERLGEEVALAVMAKPGSVIEPEELRRFVGARLAAFKVPSRVFVFDEQLPRNASGKILKRQIRDDILGEQGPGTGRI